MFPKSLPPVRWLKVRGNGGIEKLIFERYLRKIEFNMINIWFWFLFTKNLGLFFVFFLKKVFKKSNSIMLWRKKIRDITITVLNHLVKPD